MDVNSEFSDIISSQRKTLQEARLRQGQRPQDRKTREQTYTNFMMLFTLGEITQLKGIVSSALTTPPYLPCSTPMTELEPVAIKNLSLETHHRGTYLLLRSITSPHRMTAIMAVMEDENGDVILLHLKNAAKYLNSFVTIFHTMARLRCSLDVLRVVLWSRSLECTISKSSRQILRSFGRHTWITLLILGRLKYDKLSPRAAVCSSPRLRRRENYSCAKKHSAMLTQTKLQATEM